MDINESNFDRPSTLKDKLFSDKSALILTIVAFGLIILSISWFIICGSWNFSTKLDEAKVAQFGDFIGGFLGPVLSLVGIILFYVALTEQRKDAKTNQHALTLQIQALNHQIDEFQAQKEELISTRKIYEQQTKTMRTQQFDSTFYSLLNVYLQLKNNLNANGTDYFSETLDEIHADVKFEETETLAIRQQKLNESYTNIFLKRRGSLSHYFKTFYRLLKIVADCDHFNDDEKFFYSKIIRSQMSESENLILYYNLHSAYGKPARPLYLKYDILKHLHPGKKLETYGDFNFESENEKFGMIQFYEWLADFFELNIAKATDLESVEVNVQETYSFYDCIVGLSFVGQMELSVFTTRSKMSNIPLTESKFAEFIQLFLFDQRFLKNFRIPTGKEVRSSLITSEDSIQFKFIFE